MNAEWQALSRVSALADEWQAELDEGRIQSDDARWFWDMAVREVRAAIDGTVL